MSLHPSKKIQFTNVKLKKTSQSSSISAAFVPQSKHGSLPSSMIFSPLGPDLPSTSSKNIYQIARRRQRAICANLEKRQVHQNQTNTIVIVIGRNTTNTCP